MGPRGRRPLPAFVLALLLGVSLAACGGEGEGGGVGSEAATSSADSFRVGFFDQRFFLPAFASEREKWLDRSATIGGSIVRILVRWSAVARTEPRDPTDPDDPAYNWDSVDAPITAAVRAGQEPLLAFLSAPSWAEGPERPSVEEAPIGTWRPDPEALGDFAQALAERYSGEAGALPRVKYWQVWNEPNLEQFLSPQYKEVDGEPRSFSSDRYRSMLNRAYEGLKAVHEDNFVVSAALAPLGDLERGGARTPPGLYVRQLLCLDNRLRPACEAETSLDALAINVFNLEKPPQARASNKEDVLIADVGERIRAPLDAASQAGLVVPEGEKELWVTEFNWQSQPPDPDGVPLMEQAEYLQEAYRLLWRQGVDTALWFNVVDSVLGQIAPEFADRIDKFDEGGLYFLDGKPKPAVRGFKFMFVSERTDHRTVRYWGRAPGAGTVTIERKLNRRWLDIGHAEADGSQVFTGTVTVPKGSTFLRATMDGERSLARKQR